MVESAVITDNKVRGCDRRFCRDGVVQTDSVIAVRVIVGICPPSGIGRGVSAYDRVLSVGQTNDIARRVVRGQACRTALVAVDHTGRCATLERQIERRVSASGIREPVRDLLSIHERRKGSDTRPRSGRSGLGADDQFCLTERTGSGLFRGNSPVVSFLRRLIRGRTGHGRIAPCPVRENSQISKVQRVR